MRNKFLSILISSLVAMIVFGAIMFLLNGAVNYIGAIVFFIVYWVTFLITTEFIRKKGGK